MRGRSWLPTTTYIREKSFEAVLSYTDQISPRLVTFNVHSTPEAGEPWGTWSIDSTPDAIARGLQIGKPSSISSTQANTRGVDGDITKEFGGDEQSPDVHCKVSASRR